MKFKHKLFLECFNNPVIYKNGVKKTRYCFYKKQWCNLFFISDYFVINVTLFQFNCCCIALKLAAVVFVVVASAKAKFFHGISLSFCDYL